MKKPSNDRSLAIGHMEEALLELLTVTEQHGGYDTSRYGEKQYRAQILHSARKYSRAVESLARGKR